MKQTYLFFIIYSLLFIGGACADDKFISCGSGYILESSGKTDGITTSECKKLWCRDLENGKTMGDDDRAASGYKMTARPVQLCDAQNNCIECFGERNWCGGEMRGNWNPEFGAYTRGGDNATYESYQRGSCFAWRLEKPDCESGTTAILKDGKWVCAKPAPSTGVGARPSAVRRTSAIRFIR